MKRIMALCVLACGGAALADDSNVAPDHKDAWSENCGWLNWREAGSPASTQGAHVGATFASGFVWGENVGYINLGDGSPANGVTYANAAGADSGVNVNGDDTLSGLAWGENIGWINFGAGATVTPPRPARIDRQQARLRGLVWGENVGWINLDDATRFVGLMGLCGSADFNGDGDVGTDADIEAFFSCLSGSCCRTCGTADFDGDGDVGTDADIEAFFRVLGGGNC